MSGEVRRLPPYVALAVLRAVEKIDGVILIGGQATNFWAEGFSSEIPELAHFGPFTSKDVDFLGQKSAAQILADAVNGTSVSPDLDDHTPNTAVVSANIDGYEVTVDFLRSALGLRQPEKRAVSVHATVHMGDNIAEFDVKVLHPMDCLVSRVINILHPQIRRSDEIAINQLHGAYHVLGHFISTLIEQRETNAWAACFRQLHDFLIRDEYGRICHEKLPLDPLRIVDRFIGDERIDERYREKILIKMSKRIARKRLSHLSRREGLLP